jgi:hypothetical protein
MLSFLHVEVSSWPHVTVHTRAVTMGSSGAREGREEKEGGGAEKRCVRLRPSSL